MEVVHIGHDQIGNGKIGSIIAKLNIELWRTDVKKINGYVCDICGKFFKSDEPIIGHGRKRILHFCTLRCKAIWLKKSI